MNLSYTLCRRKTDSKIEQLLFPASNKGQICFVDTYVKSSWELIPKSLTKYLYKLLLIRYLCTYRNSNFSKKFAELVLLLTLVDS